MRHFFLGLVLIPSLCSQPPAARLEGKVEDPSHAAIGAARVSVKSQRTGFTAAILTSKNGLYSFLSLPPGEYLVTVEAQGFRKTELSGLVLDVSTTTIMPVGLEIGPTQETVNVVAKQDIVQVADPQGGNVVAPGDVQMLPQQDPNVMKLAVYQPGVQVSPGIVGSSNVNGSRPGSNSVKLDGIDVDPTLTPGLGSAIPLPGDLVQEFRMITYSAKAEYGRTSGAQIEMITKSGTNQFHGGLSQYLRNRLLNANDFFNNATGIVRPKLVYDDFGATLGGPVRRNRTFFLASYQGIREAFDAVRNRKVLTDQAKSGVFRWRNSGSQDIQQFDIAANDPRHIGIDPVV